MTICGLDISTSTVGISVLSEQSKMLCMEHLDLSKYDTLMSKAKAFRERMVSVSERFGVDSFVIESFLLGFSTGKSKAQTITMLAQFNGICQYILFELFGREARTLNVVRARHAVCNDLGWKGLLQGKEQKEKLFNRFVEENIYTFETGRTGKPIKQARDIVDAWVIAKASLLVEPTQS